MAQDLETRSGSLLPYGRPKATSVGLVLSTHDDVAASWSLEIVSLEARLVALSIVVIFVLKKKPYLALECLVEGSIFAQKNLQFKVSGPHFCPLFVIQISTRSHKEAFDHSCRSW